MAINNQNSGRGSKSLFSLSTVSGPGTLPVNAKFVIGVVTSAGLSVAMTVEASTLYKAIPTSINFPKKFYEINLYDSLVDRITSVAPTNPNRLMTRNITRDLVVPLNFTGSQATLDIAASTTVEFPISYVTTSVTATLGTITFNPGFKIGSFSTRSILGIPKETQYLFDAPTDTGGAEGLAITINHNASISGYEIGNTLPALTANDLVSINSSISTLENRVSAIAASVTDLHTSVMTVESDVSVLRARVALVSSLIASVSGVPAITSAQVDISVLQQQRVSINTKISTMSVALAVQIAKTSVSLRQDIVAVAASVSNVKIAHAQLSARIDSVSALLSGVSGVPAITSLRNLTSIHTQKFVSVNNKINTVSSYFTSVIAQTSVRFTSALNTANTQYSTSLITFTSAILSISALHENKTIFVNRASPVRLFFKGGFSKNGRTVNVIQGNVNGPVSIVTSGVAGKVLASRDNLFTTNGIYAAMGIMQVTSILAIATGDLI
jgi:hypothetical protein